VERTTQENGRMKWVGHVARMRRKCMYTYTVSVGICEGKRPLGILNRGWEENIKMDLREIGWGLYGSVGALVNTILNFGLHKMLRHS
jgi:hypothetical protein